MFPVNIPKHNTNFHAPKTFYIFAAEDRKNESRVLSRGLKRKRNELNKGKNKDKQFCL